MARYRQKDEVDLQWNKVRRQITRDLDTQLMNWRDRALNQMLSDAWTHYSASLQDGKVIEIETEYREFVSHALEVYGVGKNL
jgi:hypothetical protein